ncbi:ATP-binding protein [Oscillospiraceae bacterium LTW-04]|nr:ATP-binding protein [Oscillospiraceae bacterium MB24-C1]
MTKRIFSAICAMVILTTVLTAGLVSALLYDRHLSEIKQTIQAETEYIASYISGRNVSEDELELLSSITQGRVTWIAPDGTVLFDSASRPEMMENHADRQEVISALQNGSGEDTRHSATLGGLTSYYFARQMADGTVLRVAYSTQSLYSTMSSTLLTLVVVTFVVLLISVLLSRRITKGIVEPINRLDLSDPLACDSYEELYPLLSRINSQNMQIKRQMADLKKMQSEFSAIIQNMREGLVLLSNDGSILSINPSAARLLDIPHDNCVGKYLLNFERSEEMRTAIEQLAQKKSAEFIVTKGGRSYRMLANPVVTGGSLMLMMDVTEQLAAEQLRREFSANVSHELKTPLQSILGYAEIMKSGLAKPADFPRFIERIYREAQRLIALVEDIIAISHLDEGKDMPTERVELLSVARESADRLQQAADDVGVSLSIDGQPAEINGVRRLISEMICNLLDNAIKYNHKGGKASVSVARAQNGSTLLTVMDTGCGIPEAHQSRVFERFYRVDKSHSKETGGTGLGLSIVKHAAAQHNAKIMLKSKENEGTTITVQFPDDSKTN